MRTENEGRTRGWLRWLVVPAGLAFWAALALTRPPSGTDQDKRGDALAGAEMAGTLWPRSVHGLGRLAVLAAAAFALTAALGFVRWSRARVGRRRSAALDAYADREIARDRDRTAGKTGITPPVRLLAGHRG